MIQEKYAQAIKPKGLCTIAKIS